MAPMIKANAQVVAAQAAVLEQERAKRENAGPAGGLLIAVGTSLLLWAVLAQGAKLASSFFF